MNEKKGLVLQFLPQVGRLVKSHTSQGGPHGRSLTCFCSMKQLRVLLLPPGWDVSPSEGYPQRYIANVG